MTEQPSSNHLACTVWGTAESHRVLFRPDVGCPYCEISHQANEIERLEECIRGMCAHAMKAAAEETRLRAAITNAMDRLSNGDTEGGARLLRECFWSVPPPETKDAHKHEWVTAISNPRLKTCKWCEEMYIPWRDDPSEPD